MLNIEGVIDEYISQKQKDNEKERTGWYFTDLGKCLRGVYLSRLGEKPDRELDERTKRVFEVGRIFEDLIVERVKSLHEVETQGSLVYLDGTVNRPIFRGRFDLLIKGENPEVIEIKTMHSNGFWWRQKSGFQPLEHHREQVMLYMDRLRETYPNISGSILYVSKDDFCTKQIPIPYDAQVVQKALGKMALLEQAWKTKSPPPLSEPVEYDPQKGKWVVSWKAQYCDYHTQCTGDVDWLSKAKKECKERNKE